MPSADPPQDILREYCIQNARPSRLDPEASLASRGKLLTRIGRRPDRMQNCIKTCRTQQTLGAALRQAGDPGSSLTRSALRKGDQRRVQEVNGLAAYFVLASGCMLQQYKVKQQTGAPDTDVAEALDAE
jgi:hypothetical protein